MRLSSSPHFGFIDVQIGNTFCSELTNSVVPPRACKRQRTSREQKTIEKRKYLFKDISLERINLSLDFAKSKTMAIVVIHDPKRLHKRIDRCRPHKLPSSFLKVF